MAVGPTHFPTMFPVKGVELASVSAGVKYEGRKDLVLISGQAGSKLSGVFTRNAFCAAPVHIAKEHLEACKSEAGPIQLLINTGNANAGTGEQGFVDAQACCDALAGVLNVASNQVLPFSTGVIGEKLPADKICAAMPQLIEARGLSDWESVASGIMTTDTRPKGASKQLELSGQTVTITGVSKGAGMIMPNMATMLCFVTTDAKLPQAVLDELAKSLADRSFNRITIDGDTSTNDACMLLATGAAQTDEMDVTSADFAAFKQALADIYLELAHAIVRDGEGATKFVTINVNNASSSEEALDLAYTVAHSPLVKTALFASDPNWGRILAALGRAKIDALDLNAVRIWLGDVLLVERGGKADSYSEAAGQAVMDCEEISITMDLARGTISETVWTTDLSHDYVTINAEYRT